MLNLNDPPEQIAKSIYNHFYQSVADGPFPEENARVLSVYCVENMLKVCPQYIFEGETMSSSWIDADYLKLTQTLNILKK